MIRIHPLTPCTGDYSGAIAMHSGDDIRTYKQVEGQDVRLALYYPGDYAPSRKYPLLVLVHGGGWTSHKIFDGEKGWEGDYLGFLARYFARRGYLCASIDYRLMRENGQAAGYELIDLCDDCRDAAAYLKAHAQELGIDLDKTAVLGESAGGYLAAAMVTLPFMDTGFFKKAILVNAITDLTDPRWGARLCAHSAHPRMQGLSPAEQQVLMSPVCHIDQNTCPVLLLHGLSDGVVFPFHSLKFHDLLQVCGVQTQLDFIENTNHAFLLAEYMIEHGVALDALEISVDSIEEWLRQGMRS